MNAQIEELVKVWPTIAHVFSVPHTEKDYEKLVRLLDGLIDEVGEDTTHPLASLMETIGSLIETYESGHVPPMAGNPGDTLKFLMAEHGLKQADLPEIGSQGVVSEILGGKRQLNIRQIRLLAERFHVSPAAFV